MRLRPRSLFWTFAGAFLAVVAVAALVQAWVLTALTARLAEEQASSRAQRPALEASLALSRFDRNPGRIGPALHQHGAEDGTFFLLYRKDDGQIYLPWPAEREVKHRLARWIETGVDTWGLDERYDAAFGPRRGPGELDGARGGLDRRPRGPRPPHPPGDGRPPRRHEGPQHEGPQRDGPPRDGPPRDGPPRDGPRDSPPGGGRPPGRDGEPPLAGDEPGRPAIDLRPSDLPAPGQLHELGRIAVMRDGERLGDVIMVHPYRRRTAWREAGVPTVLLLPVALVLAAAAGLGLFRLLTRRLRRLEALATRVASGDLGARVADPGDDEIGRLGVELNRMAASLEQARAEIDASDAQRRRLLADISHELATPLTSIRGYAETLLDPDLEVTDAESAEYAENVLDEARRMELLLGDLFELTRLEAGIGEFHPEHLDWSALCRHTVERFGQRFGQADLGLRYVGSTGDDGAGVWVEVDGRRMEQVLENLLTNALRYVPAGGEVVVSMRARGSDAVLEVADDGPGFPEEDLPHVFDRFYRSESAQEVQGTGLGLAIVQEIVRRHDGSVEAENRAPGTGAVLRVTIPSASDAPAE